MKQEYVFFNIDTSNKIIKIKNLPSFAIAFEIFFVLFERYFIQIGIPSSIIYVLDVINIYLLFSMLKKNNYKRYGFLLCVYAIMIAMSLLAAFANANVWGFNLLLTFIEYRNLLRFLIFFLACTTFLKESECHSIFKLLLVYLGINSLYIVYQYFTFHPENIWVRGDYLNGFFGLMTGGNTFVNVLMLTVVIYVFYMWTNKKMKSSIMISTVVISVIIAGLIELKGFFLEIIMVYIYYFIRKKKNMKEIRNNMFVILAFAIVAYFILQIMYEEYPWFREAMSLSGMLELASDTMGYTGDGGLNRLTGITVVSQTIFNNNPLDIMIGIGAGTATMASVGGTGTLFNRLYSDLNYAWFSSVYTFIQYGLIGLIGYISTFIYMMKKRKRSSQFHFVSETAALVAVFLIFYGEALKTDAGYFIYFAIACGFVEDDKSIATVYD